MLYEGPTPSRHSREETVGDHGHMPLGAIFYSEGSSHWGSLFRVQAPSDDSQGETVGGRHTVHRALDNRGSEGISSSGIGWAGKVACVTHASTTSCLLVFGLERLFPPIPQFSVLSEAERFGPGSGCVLDGDGGG